MERKESQDRLLAGAKDFLSLVHNLVQNLKCPNVQGLKSIKQTLLTELRSGDQRGFTSLGVSNPGRRARAQSVTSERTATGWSQSRAGGGKRGRPA